MRSLRPFLIVLLAFAALLAVFPAGGAGASAHDSALAAAAPAAPDVTMAPAPARPATAPLASVHISPRLLAHTAPAARDLIAAVPFSRRTLAADGVSLPLLR